MAKGLIIAEVGQAHDGSLGTLHAFIDALADTGVDAVKFQIHIAEAESSMEEPFRMSFSYEDKSRFDYWKRMGFSLDQWKEIKTHCEEVGLEFVASPFSNLAVDWLEEMGVQRYKVGSGEVNNFLLLEKIGQTGKPVILSSGMSDYNELDRAVKFLNEKGVELSIVQCTTSYPTPFERLGLNVISELKQRYPELTIGLSEHTGSIFACLAAASLGAEIFEFHVTFDKRMFGPDVASSITIDEVCQLVQSIRSIETSLNNPVDKNDLNQYADLRSIFGKSLAVNKDLPKGHVITFNDLESKKPSGQGISATDFESIVGRTLTNGKRQWDFLNNSDFE
jgi:N-acetylneuraminate synthase